MFCKILCPTSCCNWTLAHQLANSESWKYCHYQISCFVITEYWNTVSYACQICEIFNFICTTKTCCQRCDYRSVNKGLVTKLHIYVSPLFKDIGLHESYMCIIPFSSHSAMFYWKSVNLIGPLIVSFSLVDDDCVHWSWKLKIIFPYFRQALSQDCMRGHPATKMLKMFGGMPWRNAWKLKCLRCIFWIFSL